MSEMALKLIAQAKREGATTLDLGNCGIDGLVPEEIGQLYWLEELRLREATWDFDRDLWIPSANKGPDNNIDELPDSLRNLRRLKFLDASGRYGGKSDLDDISILAELTELQELRLGATYVSDLSPLSNLRKLEILVLYDTEVSDLMPIAKLTNLKLLDIGRTKVKDLRPISDIIQKGVPVRSSLTGSGILIPQLDLVSPPSGIAIQGNEAILSYWQRMEEEEEKLKVPTLNWHCRLLLLGNGRVGKTTLLGLLQGKKRPKHQNRTELVDRVEWRPKFEVQVEAKNGEGKVVKGSPVVQVFDFGGQEYYHDTHHFLFGSDTAYLVLWKPWYEEYPAPDDEQVNGIEDGASNQDRVFPLEYWLDAIGHFCKIPPSDAFHDIDLSDLDDDDEEMRIHGYRRELAVHHHVYNVERERQYIRIPTMVLQTHADKARDKFLNQAHLSLNFPWIRDFEKVSLGGDDSIGFTVVLDKIKKLLGEIPILGTPISTTYAWVRDAVEALEEMEVMTVKDFITWANKAIALRLPTGIGQGEGLFFRESDIRYLIRYLDSTGSLRHFEIEALKDRVFLRPDLLKKAILNLLRELQPLGGEFSVDDAVRILGGSLQGNVETLLALLEEFKMAFRIGDSEQRRWVAPLYLPADPPAGVSMLLEVFDRPVRRIVYPHFIHKSVILELFQAYSGDILVQASAGLQSDQYVVWRDGMVIKMRDSGEYVLVKYFYGEVFYRKQAHIDVFAFKTPPGSSPAADVLKKLREINHYWTTLEEVTYDGKVFVPLEKIESASREKQQFFTHDGVIYNLEDYAAFVQIPWKRIFISYAPEDEAFCQALEKHMDPMRKKEKIALWNKAKLVAGMDRDAEIQRELRRADIVVMLLSADYFYDRDIWNVEMKETLDRAARGGCTIAWVEVRHCDWESTSLAELVPLYGDRDKNQVVGKPENDEAWVEVVRSLKDLVVGKKGGGR